MSLIQEALKRQQEESGNISPEPSSPPVQPSPGAPPSAEPRAGPPPIPETDEQPAPSDAQEPVSPPDEQSAAEEVTPPPVSGMRAWPTLVGVFVISLLLVGAGTWAMLFAFRQWKSRKQTASKQPPEAVATGPQQAVSPGQKSTAKKPAQLQPVADVPEPAGKPATAVQAAESDMQQSIPKPVEITEPEAAAAPSEPVSAPGPPQKAPVDWPFLTLTGVLGKGANGSAVINGEVIGVGESIEDVVVVSIGHQGVTLECQGETMFLKVGNSTQ